MTIDAEKAEHFIRKIAGIAKDGEGINPMENDFAYEKLHEIISYARELTGEDPYADVDG